MYQTRSLTGSADALTAHLDGAISGGSISASIENSSALSIGDELKVALSTAGGSQAIFWKVNTFGESAFMNKGIAALDQYSRR